MKANTRVHPIQPDAEGAYTLPHVEPGAPLVCPLCLVTAVFPLDAANLQAQTDGTTHVCHPLLGGCNHGFTYDKEGSIT